MAGRYTPLPPIFESRGAGFDAVRFHQYLGEYQKRWSLTHATLRRLCVTHPDHKSPAAVSAKVWIIGRTYATQIERKVASKGSQGSSLEQVSELLHGHARDIDRWIRAVPDGTQRQLTDDIIPDCMAAHGNLVQLLGTITHKRQSARSFASKYLHFHRPVIPIYDSVASKGLSGLIRWRSAFDCKRSSASEDVTYRQFVMHFRQLVGLARIANVKASVRELDWYLLEEGERLRQERGERGKRGKQ